WRRVAGPARPRAPGGATGTVSGRAVRTRGGGPPVGGCRPDQSADRRRAGDQPQHRRPPREQYLRQNGRGPPGRGGQLCPQPRARGWPGHTFLLVSAARDDPARLKRLPILAMPRVAWAHTIAAW